MLQNITEGLLYLDNAKAINWLFGTKLVLSTRTWESHWEKVALFMYESHKFYIQNNWNCFGHGIHGILILTKATHGIILPFSR